MNHESRIGKVVIGVGFVVIIIGVLLVYGFSDKEADDESDNNEGQPTEEQEVCSKCTLQDMGRTTRDYETPTRRFEMEETDPEFDYDAVTSLTESSYMTVPDPTPPDDIVTRTDDGVITSLEHTNADDTSVKYRYDPGTKRLQDYTLYDAENNTIPGGMRRVHWFSEYEREYRGNDALHEIRGGYSDSGWGVPRCVDVHDQDGNIIKSKCCMVEDTGSACPSTCFPKKPEQNQLSDIVASMNSNTKCFDGQRSVPQLGYYIMT